jgi:hypothetical protein
MIRLKHTELFIRPERVSAVIVDTLWDGAIAGYKIVIDGKIIVVDEKDEQTLIDNGLIFSE